MFKSRSKDLICEYGRMIDRDNEKKQVESIYHLIYKYKYKFRHIF